MSKAEAHRILDLARLGHPMPESLITRALIATGDLAPWTS
jgi:hypothetical protein